MTTASIDDSRHLSAAPTLAMAAGRNLIAAGAIFGSANLIQWGILSGALHLHPAMLSLVWPIAVGLFIFSVRRLRSIGGPAAIRAATWSRWAILVQIAAAVSLAGLSVVMQDWALMMWMSPIGLVFYGVAWQVAMLRGGRAWMGALALGAAASAGGVALLVGTPTQYLAYAMGLFAFALVPGLMLALTRTRQEEQ